VKAWRPAVPGIVEVFHAQMVDYAYPMHCHDTWTVLLIDTGAIRYDLDSRQCGAEGQSIAIVPPGVIHDGRAADGAPGFRKRNLCLHASMLPLELVGAAVDRTNLHDPQLRAALAALHDSLLLGEDPLDGEARLALAAERIKTHLAPRRSVRHQLEPALARALRDLLDEHTIDPISLERAAGLLQRSVPHLVRSFTQVYGVSPHAYVIGRRIESARGMLLDGVKPAEVATRVGFYDQAHFSRHFKRHTSVPPGRFAAGALPRR
jgi:AraC-like DNA-binding protein